MKKSLLFIFLVQSLLIAQSYFDVDFSGAFPPAGWTINAQATNWTAISNNNSGGEAPEARFNWSPQFVGESRLISPTFNTTGNIAVTTEFKYNLDHYGGPYTIGVATRSGGGVWNTVWSIVNPTGSIPATTEIVTINNADVGETDFQICWFFSGNSYNLNYLYLDDLKLFVPLDHDVMVKDILVDLSYPPGTDFIPQAVLKNFGLNTETFDATCEINLGGSNVYIQNCTPVTLASGEDQTVSFPSYILSASNELYEITVTTNLVGDMDPANDLKTEFFNTYTTEREMVILEIGTGTWCQYCPGSQMGADDLVTNGHSVAVIEYHNSDPFTNSYSDARNTYYGITGFPTAVFDGVEYFVGGSNTQSMYNNYLPIYQERKNLMSAFSVDIFGSNSGLNYDVIVKLNKMATIPPTWNNLVVHFTVTETDIPFNWQGQTEVDYCERLMVPSEFGTPVDLINNSSIDVPLSFTLDASWILANCQLVAFIQNLDTKEILQGDKVWISDLVPITVQTFQLTLPISNGWNMVSVPGNNTDGMGVSTWWPGLDGQVYLYNGGYTSVTFTTPGEGYWMKHIGDNTYNTGDEWPAGGIQIVPHVPISVNQGWNMIGGYEAVTPVGSLGTIGGSIDGPIYGYDGGYSTATDLVPGYAYWVKMTANGTINFPADALAKGTESVEWFKEDWGRIVVTDATGKKFTLYAVTGEVDLNQYEMPPLPPQGMFDIRYNSGRIAEDINSSVQAIDMTGVTYPLTVRVENMDMRLMDETGKKLNENVKDGEEVVINDSQMSKLMVSGELIPDAYALEQNYPNPFNPSTIIEFSLPEDVTNVKLSIYNALGEKVAELVNSSLTAGRYQYQWNAKNVATGMYIYELRTKDFVAVKKMVLMK